MSRSVCFHHPEEHGLQSDRKLPNAPAAPTLSGNGSKGLYVVMSASSDSLYPGYTRGRVYPG